MGRQAGRLTEKLADWVEGGRNGWVTYEREGSGKGELSNRPEENKVRHWCCQEKAIWVLIMFFHDLQSSLKKKGLKRNYSGSYPQVWHFIAYEALITLDPHLQDENI